MVSGTFTFHVFLSWISQGALWVSLTGVLAALQPSASFGTGQTEILILWRMLGLQPRQAPKPRQVSLSFGKWKPLIPLWCLLAHRVDPLLDDWVEKDPYRIYAV